MQLATRPVAMGGAALAAAGLIAVTPGAAPTDLHAVSRAVRLMSVDPLGGLENIPYNLYADLANMGYNETLALQEIAYALGPPDSTGGVPGWLPPGLPQGVGVDPLTDQYTLGGTGSWWMESLGNTWGWDDGNWPQVAGYLGALLPFQPFTEQLAYQVQQLAQAEIIDGAHVNCEFECSDLLGYIGGWFQTPIAELLNPAGYTYPSILQGDVTDPTGQLVVWSDQHVPPLDLSAPFTNFFNSLLEDPSQNPIHPFNLLDWLAAQQEVSQAVTQAWLEPLATGSFVYWGADTLYSIPAVIGGLVHSFSLGLIPNEFSFAYGPSDQPLGAEPAWGPTAGPSHLLPGLANGFQYLLTGGDGHHGLLGYLDLSTYLPSAATSGTLVGSLGDPGSLSADLSALLDPSTLSADLSPLLGTDVASMLASFL